MITSVCSYCAVKTPGGVTNVQCQTGTKQPRTRARREQYRGDGGCEHTRLRATRPRTQRPVRNSSPLVRSDKRRILDAEIPMKRGNHSRRLVHGFAHTSGHVAGRSPKLSHLRAPHARRDDTLQTHPKQLAVVSRTSYTRHRAPTAGFRRQRVRRVPPLRHPGPRVSARSVRIMPLRTPCRVLVQAPGILPKLWRKTHERDGGASSGLCIATKANSAMGHEFSVSASPVPVSAP